MITLEERASELYDVVRGCTLCPLSVSRTNAVPGEGPLDAEIMCIGEAPGQNEDKQGRPFVGAAGNFLSELLGAAGLRREDVYICNVLKCRPPGNRDPQPEEIEACSEYLDLQLDMVDPLVVVTLGRFSMSKWFPQQAISRIHGTVKADDGRLIVPMYHPAAALHQGNLRQVLLDDFAKLPAVLGRARAMRDSHSPTPSLEQPEVAGVALAGEGEDARAAPRAESHRPRSDEFAFYQDDAEVEIDGFPPASATSPTRTPDAPRDLPSPATQESGAGTTLASGVRADSDPASESVNSSAPAVKTEQIRLFE